MKLPEYLHILGILSLSEFIKKLCSGEIQANTCYFIATDEYLEPPKREPGWYTFDDYVKYIQAGQFPEDDIRYSIVKKHIDRWDPIDLLTFSSENEYDREIREIVTNLNEDARSVGKLIFDVFTKASEENTFCKSLEECKMIAEDILKEIQAQD